MLDHPTLRHDSVLEDMFLARFERYFHLVVRLRRLPLEDCRREFEDIRSESVRQYLELRRVGLTVPERRREALRAIARACYDQVERPKRRQPDALPATLMDQRRTPVQIAQLRELRDWLRRHVPEFDPPAVGPDVYLSTGRLSKRALMTTCSMSRRRFTRAVERLIQKGGRRGERAPI